MRQTDRNKLGKSEADCKHAEIEAYTERQDAGVQR